MTTIISIDLIVMRYFLFIFSPFIFLSCLFPKKPTKFQKEGIFPIDKKIEINLGQHGKEIKVLYSGSGGVVVDYGKEALITDPYFSNNPFMSIMLGKIWTRPYFITTGLKRFEQVGISPSKINHVFIAHSHYDHLLDLPFIYQKKLMGESLRIYGSASTYNVMQRFIDSDSVFINIANSAFYPFKSKTSGYNWISISDKVRVLPIESAHAPHFLKIHLMEGTIRKEGIKDFNSPTDKTRAKHWKTGGVFSFLIDYVENDSILLRLFIQSTSCAPPYGLPPQSEISKRKVDVAFIGVASTQNVKDYPKTLLNFIEAQKIVLVHWEDFFRDYTKPARTVRLTNVKKFFKRVKEAYGDIGFGNLKGKVIMPPPGTVFHLKY